MSDSFGVQLVFISGSFNFPVVQQPLRRKIHNQLRQIMQMIGFAGTVVCIILPTAKAYSHQTVLQNAEQNLGDGWWTIQSDHLTGRSRIKTPIAFTAAFTTLTSTANPISAAALTPWWPSQITPSIVTTIGL